MFTNLSVGLAIVVIGLAIWALIRTDRALTIVSVAVLILGIIHALNGFAPGH